MKKSLYAIAALALVLLGCSKKEFNETFAPGDVVTVRAQVNDTYTKVAADNAGTFSWQDGDKITILNDENAPFEFATVKGGTDAAFTSTSFSGGLGTIAYYPASASHTKTVFNLASNFEWVENASNMPMIGTVNTSEKKVSFKTAGAAIKLVCFNVPADARKLVVSSDSKNLSGAMTISSGSILTADGSNAVSITFAAGHPTNMVFYVPVPTGNLGKLTFVMKDGSDANVSTPQTTKQAITMDRQHIVAAPALNCDGGTVLWSEDWSDYSKDALPSSKTDRKGYGDVSITYTETNGAGSSPGTTKIYTENTAGGVSPELLVGKKGSGTGAAGGTFKASGIPTNGAASMKLTFKHKKTVELSFTSGITASATKFTSDGEETVTLTNSGSLSTFDLTFTATTTSNVRLDDIVLTTPGASITAPTITITGEDNLEIDPNGGNASTTFTYTGEVDSTPIAAVVEAGASWLTASISGSTLTVSAAKNTGATRSATVTLRATGVSKVINVRQLSSIGKVEQVLFHESFGDNSESARAWNDSYSVKTGVSSVYSGITGYTITNAKQSKNTGGSSASGLNQTTAGTDAVIIIGPLAVEDAEDMVLTYQWKAASIKGTYSTSLYYATSSGGSYTEVAGTGDGATTFVERRYTLPAAAQVNTLYLKIVWNTSNTSGVIDEVDLSGKY